MRPGDPTRTNHAPLTTSRVSLFPGTPALLRLPVKLVRLALPRPGLPGRRETRSETRTTRLGGLPGAVGRVRTKYMVSRVGLGGAIRRERGSKRWGGRLRGVRVGRSVRVPGPVGGCGPVGVRGAIGVARVIAAGLVRGLLAVGEREVLRGVRRRPRGGPAGRRWRRRRSGRAPRRRELRLAHPRLVLNAVALATEAAALKLKSRLHLLGVTWRRETLFVVTTSVILRRPVTLAAPLPIRTGRGVVTWVRVSLLVLPRPCLLLIP